MKNGNKIKKNEIMFFGLLFLFILLIPLFFPIYHPFCGFFSPFRWCKPEGKLLFTDGKTPVTLLEIKTLKNFGSFLIPQNISQSEFLYQINFNTSVTDFWIYNKTFYFPKDLTPLGVFILQSFSCQESLENILYSLIIFQMFLFFIISVLLFLTIKKITKNRSLSFLIVVLTFYGSSFLIYSHSLFLKITLQALGITGIYYSLYEENRKWRHLIFYTFFIIFLFSSYLYEGLLFLILVCLLIWKNFIFYEDKKKFLFFILFTGAFYLVISEYIYPNGEYTSISEVEPEIRLDPFYAIYPKYISALNLQVSPIYHYFLYLFKEPPGNALFLRAYSFFAYLFSPSGFIYNSPFLLLLIFLIILKIKNLERKEIGILIITLWFIFLYSSLSVNWKLGYTPRYVRYSQVILPGIILVGSKFLGKALKNKYFFLVFIILSSISILNAFSLTLRYDWSSSIPDYPAPDYIIFPFIPSETQKDVVDNIDLTQYNEQNFWILDYETNACNPLKSFPKFTDNGLLIGPCLCTFPTYAYRRVLIPLEAKTLVIEACGPNINKKDGKIANVYIDNSLIGKLFVPDQECVENHFDITSFADNQLHTLKIEAKLYGRCTDETIYIRNIKILKIIPQKMSIGYSATSDVLEWKTFEGNNCSIIKEEDKIDMNNCLENFTYAEYEGMLPYGLRYGKIKICGMDRGILTISSSDFLVNKTIEVNNECKVLTFDFPRRFKIEIRGDKVSWYGPRFY